jgi:hypothetical protein
VKQLQTWELLKALGWLALFVVVVLQARIISIELFSATGPHSSYGTWVNTLAGRLLLSTCITIPLLVLLSVDLVDGWRFFSAIGRLARLLVLLLAVIVNLLIGASFLPQW